MEYSTPPTRLTNASLPVDSHWAIEAVYEREYQLVVAWLRDQAARALQKRNATVEQALKADPVRQVRDMYGREPQTIDQKLLSDAEAGLLARKAPGRSSIKAYRLASFVSMFAEVGVGILTWLVGGSLIYILTAILLALGGFLIGQGVAGLLLRQWVRREAGDLQVKQGAPVAETMKIGIGSAIVLGLSYLRTGGGGEDGALAAAVITFLLAMAVTAFEAMYVFTWERYRIIQADMFKCQKWYATRQFAELCAEGGSFQELYRTEVTQIAEGSERALSRRRPQSSSGGAPLEKAS